MRGAPLIGNGPEALKYVSMVGNDLKLDEGIGTCGKEGQSVPVGVGIPTVKIDRMTEEPPRTAQELTLEQIAADAVRQALAGGATDARVHHLGRRGVPVSVRMQEVET